MANVGWLPGVAVCELVSGRPVSVEEQRSDVVACEVVASWPVCVEGLRSDVITVDDDRDRTEYSRFKTAYLIICTPTLGQRPGTSPTVFYRSPGDTLLPSVLEVPFLSNSLTDLFQNLQLRHERTFFVCCDARFVFNEPKLLLNPQSCARDECNPIETLYRHKSLIAAESNCFHSLLARDESLRDLTSV